MCCSARSAASGRTEPVNDPLGRPVAASYLMLPDGTAVVESAERARARPRRGGELDPLRASSAGLGELLAAVIAWRPARCSCASAARRPSTAARAFAPSCRAGPTTYRCASRATCATRCWRARRAVFGAAEGREPRGGRGARAPARCDEALAPYSALAGSGAGGGLGAALASLGGELVEGAELVLDAIGFDERARSADLVVTGEGTVDETTFEGKAPGAVVRRCERLGVRCVLFGGRVEVSDTFGVRHLSGDPARAREDLEALCDF